MGTEGKRVKLALGSGGARGYAHIGVIAELQARGYEIVGVAGSSMGALVGGLFAAGRLDEFTSWATALGQFEVARLLDPAFSEPGVIRAGRVLDRIREMLGELRIEDLAIPYVAVATDLTTGRSIWFRTGELDAAIRASISIPGFITPVLHDGHVLVDGGVLDPLPVVATMALGAADLTIGVDLSGAPDPAYDRAQPRTNWFTQWWRASAQRLGRAPAETPDDPPPPLSSVRATDVAQRAIDIMLAAITRQHLAAHPPDLVISVPQNICGTMDFHRAGPIIEQGRMLAAAALDAMPDGVPPPVR
ncbi:patatin-like phospholipase family protein [Nocardia seriolae]|uniref:PNPLA domain-containing protein n=1 Tax=Nocardia seriolae TaxID=37332 RepID=A0A0B8NKZ0_9NOCA|nr:patatin-like phospholipase family protein [Nocardia seriolae]MTJ64202.1 esterase [Nocardia seriolae]MTJ73917.1 esterase [Nocardia seriolae]MTJ89195.1 esterase [Nocardia seriolae]MTK33173.1 esterase [Nocardia seriolae]MTK42130.1 esterase [Nocardia seriolae]